MVHIKSKEKYGFYCDVCGNNICKFKLDYKSCGGYCIGLPHKLPKKQEVEYADICYDCLKVIMQDGVDSL